MIWGELRDALNGEDWDEAKEEKKKMKQGLKCKCIISGPVYLLRGRTKLAKSRIRQLENSW